MSNIWVVSDTHFNHANILKFTDSRTGKRVRTFADVTEMNEMMIQRWNEVVRPGDKVYHLGDVFFGDKEAFKKLWPRLMGSKRLIVGNHDDIPFLASGGFFQKVQESRVFKPERMIFSHRPLHPNEAHVGPPSAGTTLVNVHGHIHQNPSPKGAYINVSVEAIDYRPIAFEELTKQVGELL
jgi:calcineurin-like phosphoesterase family protein